jgi:phenylacetate-CoA ligase
MVDGALYAAAEARPHRARLASQEARLRRVLSSAAPHAPALRAALAAAGLTPEGLTLADLPRLPLLRKERLPAVQAGHPPFGGWLGGRERLRRIFISPGPIYEPEAGGEDYWGFAPALHAAGFRSGDVVINTFSYHFTPAGAMFDGALGALGCVAVPTGVGNLDLQVKTLLDLRARAFIGTPSFLAAVVAKIAESGSPSPLEVAFVSGEPLPESLRADLELQSLRVSQGYATGDVGLIAYECPARQGLHLADRVIVELVDPATGAPVPHGSPGEVAITFLHEIYPVLRLATGDLSRAAGGICPCGRTSRRLAGILGRVGDAVKVRGLFLHPLELDRAMARHPEVLRYQATVTRGADYQDALTVAVELRSGGEGGSLAGVAQSIRDATRLRAEVTAVAPGTIAADAKKIIDRRQWE